jgi:hypothetical protein
VAGAFFGFCNWLFLVAAGCFLLFAAVVFWMWLFGLVALVFGVFCFGFVFLCVFCLVFVCCSVVQ